jgi:hypothetical protein
MKYFFGRKAIVPGQLQQKPAPAYSYDDVIHEVRRKLQERHELAREI